MPKGEPRDAKGPVGSEWFFRGNVQEKPSFAGTQEPAAKP
jgi:hypothetical protein